MNKKRVSFIFGIFLIMSIIGFISAEEIEYDLDYGKSGIQISSLKYEPYPVNPGEYFEIWIQAYSTINAYAKFELIEEYPFSLDSNEDAVREYADFSGAVLLHYKIRVDEDAVEGNNTLKLSIQSGKYSETYFLKLFDIPIAEAQTDFDLVVQDYTSSEISLAIANIGKNTANSMIVRIPIQEGYTTTGTNGQMVGNLESGDYTIVSYTLSQTRGSTGILDVQIDYTDNIGERRTVLKEIQLSSQIISNFSSNFSGSELPGGFIPGGNFPGMQKKAKWPYFLAGSLIVIIVGFILYVKYKKQIKSFLKKKEKKGILDEKKEDVPEWIKKVKEKERK
jgi:hypothetical protein